jgi:hypothetical protein
LAQRGVVCYDLGKLAKSFEGIYFQEMPVRGMVFAAAL